MKLFKNEEEAVSPVIGVILMVAIVVILAAVIAAFVFGMAGTVPTTKAVAVTAAQPDDTTIQMTYQGGKDANTVSLLDWSVTPGTGAAKAGTIPSAGGAPSVGDMATFTAVAGDDLSGKDHVLVVATFADGTEQVVLDTYV